MLSQTFLRCNTVPRRYTRSKPFTDRVKILLSSGAGGDGASVFGTAFNQMFGGPTGGNGGKGGDLFVTASNSVTDLSHIAGMCPKIAAESGRVGYAENNNGRGGNPTMIIVPQGTQIIDIDTNDVVVDLEETDMKVLLLEGGQGGKGNAAFANAKNHSPKDGTRGLPGNTMLAQFELKTIADVGLVGFPNVGKSSLLGAISTSKPKVAPYPFTTLHPYVGHVHDIHGNWCSVADLPGLIEGAYENRGLGHQFLRHIERTSALVYVIDMYETRMAGSDEEFQPWEVLEILDSELEYYMAGLSQKVQLVFANKIDLLYDTQGNKIEEKLRILQKKTHLPVFPVSAQRGLELGPNHPDAQLSEPIKVLCNMVFESKRVRQEMKHQEKESLENEVDSVFRSRFFGHFSPVDYSSWRSHVKPSNRHNSIDSHPNQSRNYPDDNTDEGSSVGGTHSGSTLSAAIALSRAKRLASHDSNRTIITGSSPTDTTDTPAVINEEEMSLVDQQMNSLFGDSGFDERFDMYANMCNKSSLKHLRDATMKGRVWSRTREPGEKLKDEKW